MPRIPNPFRHSAPSLDAGAPGVPATIEHPRPAQPPGMLLQGAPGRSLGPAGVPVPRSEDVEVAHAADPAWELVACVVALAAVCRLADGPGLWVAALLAGLAVALASLEVLGGDIVADDSPAGTERGVPVEALLVIAAAGFASVLGLPLVPVGLLLVPGLIAVGALVAACTAVERRILAASAGPGATDRSALLGLVVLIAFLAFTGIAAAIPGAFVELPPGGIDEPVRGMPLDGLALLSILDGLVAGVLGYRVAALRPTTVRPALASAVSYAAVVAIGAAALRAVALPRLLGPALLTLVFYLWSAYRDVPDSTRRDARWIWEMALLTVVGIVVVAWNLLTRS